MNSKKCCDAVVEKIERYDKLGLTHEYLFAEYIVKNKSLQFLADEKNVKIGVIRNALTTHNIVKSAASITKNRTEAMRKTATNPNRKQRSPEDARRAQRASAESRNANRKKALEQKGITHEYLYDLYITQNQSLKTLSETLNTSIKSVRAMLKLFHIKKDETAIIESRKAGLKAYYADEEKVKIATAKGQAIISERYGNKWYRVTASSQEKKIYDTLVDNFPELEIRSGDYSVIKNPKTNASMQLDIYIPQLNFAIEFNGEYWHDREGFEKDLHNGTCLTREMLKMKLCNNKGITLIHIWDSDFKNDAEEIISDLIEQLSALSHTH